MRLTLPNLLTIFRLLAAPSVALVFLIVPRPWADLAALALFLAAAATDWLDGALARAWGQTTKLGTMLDPIADKAMVVIALAVLLALIGPAGWLLIPAAIILLREVFVSGLREYLGDVAGTLKVTKLAKWKTATQMLAIGQLLAMGYFEQRLAAIAYGLADGQLAAIFSGEVADTFGVGRLAAWLNLTLYGGLLFLWLAAGLTALTGWDYFRKAAPHLREDET